MCWKPCDCGLSAPVWPLMKPNSRSRDEPRKSSPPLYAGPATAPGEKLAGGKPFGPGTNVRVGLKSGSPRKWTTAGPNLFASAEGESRVTVCTQAAHEIAILASLGA